MRSRESQALILWPMSPHASDEIIVAAVIVKRLFVVLPQISPPAEAFQSFSFEWRQHYRREYPQEFLDASSSRGHDEGEAEYEPAPTVTKADETNDRRSLQKALNTCLFVGFHMVAQKTHLYGISLRKNMQKKKACESVQKQP